MTKKNVANRLLAAMLIGAVFIGGLTLSNRSVEASNDGDCFVQANEARRDRPSGALTSDGKSITYDYSHLPDQKKATLICVNDKLLDPNVPVETEQGVKVVPMKVLFEAVGASYKWDSKSKAATVKGNGKTIQVKLNSSKATVNGQSVKMELPARMKWGNVYIPLDFAAEQLELHTAWQMGSNMLRIVTYPEISLNVVPRTASGDTSDYYYGNSFRTANRYLLENDGTISLLETDGDKLRVQRLTKDFEKIGEIKLARELDEFGGAHVGEDGNYYIVYGQSNMEESSGKAVYRVVKYDKKWTRLASLDISDVYVTLPFYASNLTMDSHEGKLVIHSARKRYLTPDDGLHHQSNITFQINMKDMSLIYSGGQWPYNHVSHSFATYVRFDENRIVYADHGDAYPRSIVLHGEQDGRIQQVIELLKFPGKIGDNYTGARLGGLEVAKDNYLLAGSSVSLTEQYGKSKAQNLFIGVVPKAAKEDSEAHVVWLTRHPVKSSVIIEETHLVKIDANKFVVLWTEAEKGKKKSLYAVIDGAGEQLRKPTELEGIASPGNLKPLVLGNSVVWYSYNQVYQSSKKQDGIEFYTLQVD